MSISTHTLTWSVTGYLKFLWNFSQISTHTLTWSVTKMLSRINFHVLFQLTRSRGAWLEYSDSKGQTGNFNSHAHVERDFCIIDKTIWFIKFQLTRSRGAWRYTEYVWRRTIHFNSHAHVERDWSKILRGVRSILISTHTLTWSVTMTMNTMQNIVNISTHTLTWSVTCCVWFII